MQPCDTQSNHEVVPQLSCFRRRGRDALATAGGTPPYVSKTPRLLTGALAGPLQQSRTDSTGTGITRRKCLSFQSYKKRCLTFVLILCYRVSMTNTTAVRKLERAGKYLVKTRPAILAAVKTNVSAVEAAESDNPDLHALALLSILLLRVCGNKHDGWATRVEQKLSVRCA